MGETLRVVGKNAASPGCNDIIFAIGFIVNVLFIMSLFFTWVGDGLAWFPENHTKAMMEFSNVTTESAGAATAATFGWCILFATIWVFIYLAIMKAAALTLIVVINLLLIACWVGFGFLFFLWGSTCKDREEFPGACTDAEQVLAYIGGIAFFILAVLHLLWLCCVRNRIMMTAKMLKAVASALSACPGTILIAYMMALVSVIWCLFWMGAFVEANIWLAGGKDKDATWDTVYGEFIGLLFGMLISFFWGYKVSGTL